MKHLMRSRTTVQFDNFEENQVQPNAVDLKIKSVSLIHGGTVVLVGDRKQHAKRTVVEPDDEGHYVLTKGKYDIVFDGKVVIGDGEAGFLITRSSLNRNGITISSGLYDTGYNSIIGGVLHVPQNTTLVVGKNERLAQFLLFDADALHDYNGAYNENKGV